MSKEGRIIEQVDAKSVIRRNAESATDWEYHEDAVFFYGLAVRFRDELIDPLERVDRSRMSDPVISFEDERNNKVLATYTVGRNALGLRDQINFNAAHYEYRLDEENKPEKVWKFGKWSQAETLLHEQVHLYMHHLTDVDGKRRPSHGAEFVQKCKELGLNVTPVHGSHFQVADADSPFARVMKELGIQRPDDVPRDEGEKPGKGDWFRPKKTPGRSTLTKWTCPHCNMNVRLGIKDDPRLVHDTCSEELGEKVFLVKADGKSHTIYKSK